MWYGQEGLGKDDKGCWGGVGLHVAGVGCAQCGRVDVGYLPSICAGPWIKSYAARLSHIQGYLPSTKAKATTHTASVAAWRLPTAQEPHLTGKSNTTRGLMATTRAQRRQREVEYDNTAVPTDVQIGVTDVQDMAQALNPTVAKEGSVMEEDPDAPGGKTYEIVAKLMRDQGLQGDPTCT